MTVDELVELCEGLSAGMTIERIVGGLHADLLDRDPPINMGVLVRFLAGERPRLREANYTEYDNGEAFVIDDGSSRDDGAKRAHERLRQQIGRQLPDHDDEIYEPPAPAGKKAAERTKDGLAGLGEFDGIVLP